MQKHQLILAIHNVKEARHISHLLTIQGQIIFACVDKSQNSRHLYGELGELLIVKGHREATWGAGNILFLDLDGSYTDIHICKN